MVDLKLLDIYGRIITAAVKSFFLDILDNRRIIYVAIEDVYQMHNTSAWDLEAGDVFGGAAGHLIEKANLASDLDKDIAMGARNGWDIKKI